MGNDGSGYSVSTAGDVNGDGLDDLIVGAWRFSGVNNQYVLPGKSYVIIGKTDGTAKMTKDLPLYSLSILVFGAPIIKSSKPSPLTSPAVETEIPLLSRVFSPIMTKPPVPLEIADRLIAVLSILPKTT
jgi:hypothetical protein